MKKYLLTVSVLLLSIYQINAQNILNGDFSSFTAKINSLTDVNYTNWDGDARFVNNAFTDGGNAAKLDVYTYTTNQCVGYGYVKGKYQCTQYSQVTAATSQTINQVVSNITNIPLELIGDYSFTSNNVNIKGWIIVTGNFNGKSFRDSLILSNNATTETGKIKLTLKPYTGTAIGALNSLSIQISSCFNCTGNLSLISSLVVDNLEFSNPTVGIESYSENSKLVFPNPATDKIFTEEPVEIYSLTGQLLLSGNTIIDISNLQPGLYIVKSKTSFTKIIKLWNNPID